MMDILLSVNLTGSDIALYLTIIEKLFAILNGFKGRRRPSKSKNREKAKAWSSERLFEECYEPIFSFVEGILEDKFVTKDIVNESFRLCKNLVKKSKDKCVLNAALYMTAWELALPYLKEVSRPSERQIALLKEISKGVSSKVMVDRIYHHEVMWSAYKILGELPAPYKQVIGFVSQGLSRNEVAVLLNKSPQSVERDWAEGIRMMNDRMMEVTGDIMRLRYLVKRRARIDGETS